MQVPQFFTVTVYMDNGQTIVLADAQNIRAFTLNRTLEEVLETIMRRDPMHPRILLEYDHHPKRAIMVDRSKISHVEIK